MRLHYLQHDYISGPGSITLWAEEHGAELSATMLYLDEAFPPLESVDWLFILGGPMNVDEVEQYPWLAREKRFIRDAIAAGKTVVGLCLGAQLIAEVIGGTVTANPQPEIGWLPVRWSDPAREHPQLSFFPETSVVLEWHSDTFCELPQEVQVMAESAACRHQMFVYRERVFGFQFHLEITEELLLQMIEGSGAELKRLIDSRLLEMPLGNPEGIQCSIGWMAEFLDRLALRFAEIRAGR
ncbi:glutamine amidotransferase [compost metagenome]